MSTSVEGQALMEWTECRATIARMDTILEDLRKYGFTLITGLLTASAFIGAGTGRPDAGVAAYVVVMVLVATLFSVDTYYAASMSGAVERALDLEAKTRPPIILTKTIHQNCHEAKVIWITLGLYVALLVVALGLAAVTAMGVKQMAVAVTSTTVVIGLLLLGYMIAYWSYVDRQVHLSTEKKREWPI